MAVAETTRVTQAVEVHQGRSRWEQLTPLSFVLPAVLVILFLSIFPLIISLYVSLVRLQFDAGRIELNFVGFNNYAKLLVGINQQDFLGVFGTLTIFGWVAIVLILAALAFWLFSYLRDRSLNVVGFIGRTILGLFLCGLGVLTVLVLSPGGRAGTLWVTLFYVFVGLTFQYTLGLGLAYLCAQHLPGRRFFRVVFLLPMMITPVGVAYMFRMFTDTTVGPLYPLWVALGLQNFAWINDQWTARAAIMVVDIWQWTPFMFIVLLAALESLPTEPVEAAVVDGASGWQIFRELTFPALLPVTTTLLLIRMIEAFKIVDLPSTMTGGGPGTATQSMTLEGLYIWQALDIGGSAAIAYLLLIVVTVIVTAYGQLVRNRVAAE